MRRLLLNAACAALFLADTASADEVVPNSNIVAWRNANQYVTSDGALHTISRWDRNVEMVVFTNGQTELQKYHRDSQSALMVAYVMVSGALTTYRVCRQVSAAAWSCAMRGEIPADLLAILDANATKDH